MHYLVTGGCGFIGSHLVDRLLADGHRLTVIDDLSTGKRERVPANVALLVADITTPGVFDAVTAKVDGCFHLAASVSVQQSTKAWLRTHQVNLSGFVALLDSIARQPRKIPVVFASSAAAYGNIPDVPLKESVHCAPRSAYGVDKLACEWHANIATHVHDIPAIGLRIFNAYGPRQDASSPYSGAVSIFIDRMKQHQPVTIYGDGEQSRDFIYVGDVVSGMVAAMSKLESKQLAYGIFNLCTGTQTSVNALVRMIADLTGSHSAITHGAQRTAEVRHSVGSTELSHRMLGFEAQTTLEAGLARTLGAL